MKRPEHLPLISIIIPIYNREMILKKTLSSIQNQPYRPIELILVDNHSEDRTLEWCEAFKTNNPDLLFDVKVIQEKKKGANAARNTGLTEATGDYVIFFDSDDEMYDDCISTIVGELMLNKYPDALAYTSLLRLPNGSASKRPKILSNDPADHLFDTLIPTHSICLKRTALEQIGPWNEELERWQDLEFGFRILLQIKDIKWLKDKPLYEVHQHPESISGKSFETDHAKMYASLMAIRSNIDCQRKGKTKDRQQRALCYRMCTIAAQLRKEGCLDLGKYYLQKALTQLPETRKKRAISLLNFQFFYEGKGGRGLWRIARIIL